MKGSQHILVVVFFVLVSFLAVKNPMIKSLVRTVSRQVLGAPVRIDSLGFGVFKQRVRIKGFKIYNPKGFPKGILLDIGEIKVEYDFFSIFQRRLHFPLVVLELKEMILVKDKDGNLNVDALKVAQKPAGSPKGKKKTARKIPMRIDTLRLNLGQVIVKDYTEGDPPLVLAYDIGVRDKEYKNVKSAEQLSLLIMGEAMGPTALKSAGIYSAATVLGVEFLPVRVAGVLISKDSGVAVYQASYEKARKAAWSSFSLSVRA